MAVPAMSRSTRIGLGLATLGGAVSGLMHTVHVHAATPPGAVGPTEVPPSLLEQLSAMTGPVLAMSGAVAIVGVVGVGSGRLEGRASRVAGAAFLAIGMLVGVLLGRGVAYSTSIGGLSGAFAVPLGASLLAVASLVAAAVGTVGWLARRRRSSAAILGAFGAAGTLVLGTGLGIVSAGATGGTYREPVVLTSPGTGSLTLIRPELPFTANPDGPVQCASEGDGQVVHGITGLELGELGPGTVRGGLTLLLADGTGSLELFIDGGDLPDGADQPFWTGAVTYAGVVADGTSGSVAFERLTREPAAGPVATADVRWPEVLGGTLRWTCQAWTGDAGPPSQRST
ncbi:MAG TPA: hypothetical protein VF494_05740 [Candidatus Limnocylindrales bacterium]